MLHLNRLSEKVPDTGMTAKNLSIVWAPNLLRTPLSMHTGCDNGFGGVSIKLNGETDCRNGKVSAPKPSNNNKTIKQYYISIQGIFILNMQILQFRD